VHVKDGLVSKESLFLTDMLQEILEKLPAMLRSVTDNSIQVFLKNIFEVTVETFIGLRPTEESKRLSKKSKIGRE
jgi:hypothetical protein